LPVFLHGLACARANDLYPGTTGNAVVAVGLAIGTADRVVLHRAGSIGLRKNSRKVQWTGGSGKRQQYQQGEQNPGGGDFWNHDVVTGSSWEPRLFADNMHAFSANAVAGLAGTCVLRQVLADVVADSD